MKLEDCAFFTLTTAGRRAANYWKQNVTGLGVTGVQGMLLNALHVKDQISSIQLGKQVKLDSATMTGVLDRLEAAGLIERMPDPEDRRAVQIGLTTKGKEVAAQLHDRMVEANQKYIANLSAGEFEQLKTLLAKLG